MARNDSTVGAQPFGPTGQMSSAGLVPEPDGTLGSCITSSCWNQTLTWAWVPGWGCWAPCHPHPVPCARIGSHATLRVCGASHGQDNVAPGARSGWAHLGLRHKTPEMDGNSMLVPQHQMKKQLQLHNKTLSPGFWTAPADTEASCPPSPVCPWSCATFTERSVSSTTGSPSILGLCGGLCGWGRVDRRWLGMRGASCLALETGQKRKPNLCCCPVQKMGPRAALSRGSCPTTPSPPTAPSLGGCLGWASASRERPLLLWSKQRNPAGETWNYFISADEEGTIQVVLHPGKALLHQLLGTHGSQSYFEMTAAYESKPVYEQVGLFSCCSTSTWTSRRRLSLGCMVNWAYVLQLLGWVDGWLFLTVSILLQLVGVNDPLCPPWHENQGESPGFHFHVSLNVPGPLPSARPQKL